MLVCTMFSIRNEIVQWQQLFSLIHYCNRWIQARVVISEDLEPAAIGPMSLRPVEGRTTTFHIRM